jgi:hypothetical protein
MSMYAMCGAVACAGSLPSFHSDDCLAEGKVREVDTDQCIVDPLKVRARPAVQAVLKAFGMPDTRVKFLGCEYSCFAAGPTGSGLKDPKYLIIYPMGRQFSSATHLAPITHELAHAYQMELAGSYAQVRNKYKSSKQIELDADFLTGLIFRNFISSAQVGDYQQNLSLFGTYFEGDVEAHGTPTERGASFLFGYNLRFAEYSNDIKKANNEFRNNLFGYAEEP